jgi:hypothetical protein
VKVGVDGFVVLTFCHHGCDLVRWKLMSSRSIFALQYNWVSSTKCIACIFAGLWKQNVVVSSCCGNNVEFGRSFRCAGGDDGTLRRPMVCSQERRVMTWGRGRWTKMGCRFWWPLWNWRCKSAHIHFLSPCLFSAEWIFFKFYIGDFH